MKEMRSNNILLHIMNTNLSIQIINQYTVICHLFVLLNTNITI